MIVASLLAWFDTCIGVLKAYWCRLVRRTKEGSQEGGPYLPMTWLEAHMLKNDAFPSYMHASPICYVINSAIFFRDGLPSTDEVKTVLQDKLLKYHRFASVADPDNRSWNVVNVDVNDHFTQHDPVADTKVLEDKINEIISLPLDPTRPLWEVHTIPVVKGEDCMLFRTHHSMADGLSLVSVYQSLTTEADGSPAKVVPGKAVKAHSKLTFEGLFLMAVDTLRSALHILYTVFQPLESSFTFNTPRKHRGGDMRWSGSRRAVLFKPFSLEYVKAITKRTPKKVTVNDVLLSASVGAIRAYSGDTVNDTTTSMRTLLALGFPANLPNRPSTDRLTNTFSINACDLSKAIRATDPVSRVMATNRAMNRLKKSMEAFVEFWLMNVFFPLLPVQIYQYIAKRYFANHTMLFSNVPGPAKSLYFAGKEVTGVQGIFLDAISEVTLISYNGKVYYNIALDQTVVKDWPRFEHLFRQELLELGKTVGVPSDIAL
ncbi:conserved hypothetical protein [Perkinsus marinus ATCC 50983]|uniref:Uncharacterized protein n=1 Tax=Perkinsus marinus (strain ATCC 50983 / TXsc) TaxID=423536 RepID=C5LYD4_PERM5|nr:conserved hypothetical protein [Perkinsus marinus ATCC 50983]EEQ98172.1 conserved hypothetical protein [Perkinsus marinus ATCC 50983]|eukprot:XP_002765455.1 conserved hypothetical protein [Perkinsus marinus ATCC 50983]